MASIAPPRTADDEDTSTPEDWPAQVADQIERVVGTVRDRTVGPAVKVSKYVVYGMLAAIVGMVVVVVAVIFLVRAINLWLPDAVFGEEHVWVVYLILGSLFVLGGALSWRLRRAPVSAEQTARP